MAAQQKYIIHRYDHVDIGTLGDSKKAKSTTLIINGFCLLFSQGVVVVAGFTPVEEVERISMGPRESAEKVVRDFCKGGLVGDQYITI